MSPPNERAQDIGALGQRYDELRTKKIAAHTNLETSTQNLEGLKRLAREKYGTDDLEALRAKLEEMKDENNRRLADYDRHLATIEQQLSQVEAEHAKTSKQEGKE